MMSSGKTTIGKILAEKLNYTFVDLDSLIEKDQKMTISAIFSEKGEAHFRDVESRILKSLAQNKKLVIASGGGTPCFFDNMTIIKSLGTSFYLDIPAHALAKRISYHGRDDRPILSGAESIEALLQTKITEREFFYQQADYQIHGDIPKSKIIFTILETML